MAALEELLCQVDALRAEGKLPSGVTREERISFVYGNCVLANPLVTREMVEAAVDGVPYRGGPGLPPPPARTVSGKAFALSGPPFSDGGPEAERGFVGPRVTLQAGVEPVAVVVGFEDDGARGVAVVGADAPGRPVLCIQPMTHGDARFAEGRRAGLREAAAMMRDSAKRLDDGDPDAFDRLMATTFRSCADSFEFEAAVAKAGEP